MLSCSGNEVVVGGSYDPDVENRSVDADLSRELEAMARQLHPVMKVENCKHIDSSSNFDIF